MNAKLALLFKNRWLKVAAAVVLSCILVLPVTMLHPIRQADQNTLLNLFTSHLDKRIPELMKTYQIPGTSIALVKNNSIVWSQAYGFADIEDGRRMTTNTICRVQSISKPITAWGVMKLVESGEIDLDIPISRYLNNWQLPESEFSGDITVRQLLSHTAGMSLGDILMRFAPQEQMPSLEEKLTMEAYPFQKPGKSFSYSNTGYNLLELLIEEVTGLDFAYYMQQEILTPLDMSNSSFEWSTEFDPPVPAGYNLKVEKIPAYVYPEKASGGLFATAEDIAKFAMAGMDATPQVLNTEIIDILYSPVVNDLGMYSLVFDAYGLGYYIEYLNNGQMAVSHGGQGTGIMTHFHSVPETGDAIVILTNSQRSWPFIANVLSDWAEWNGFESVGMEAIMTGQVVLWVFVGFIWLVIFLRLLILAGGILSKEYLFTPFSRHHRFSRVVQFILFVGISVGLIWCISQPYLNITSIFPRVSGWLGISAFVLGLSFLTSSIFVRVCRD